MRTVHPWLVGLEPVPHGGAAQLAGVEVRFDLSATTLPGGPLPGVVEAMASVDLAAYPDPHCHALRTAVGRLWGLDPACVLPANGSVSLIRAIARAVLAPAQRSAILGPTFGEYAQAVRLAGAEPVMVSSLAALREAPGPLRWACRPNNPTGAWVAGLEQAVPEGGWLVVDEAYAGFLAEDAPPEVVPGVLRLRSWTKDRGLAGLRLGFLIAEPDVVRLLGEVLDPWGVSAVAQAVGVAVCQPAALEELERRLALLWQERAALIAALEEQGWEVAAGRAPYFLVHVGDAARAKQALLAGGVLVRDCSSFGLPELIRVSPKGPAAHAALVEGLARAPTSSGW